MIWTYAIKFYEEANDTIVSVFKNNNLYVSCGFAHYSKTQEEKAFHMAQWILLYAEKMMMDANKDFTQLVEINNIIRNVLEYININYPRI